MKKAHTVPVLMYHHVSPHPGMITCTPDNFESQLKWLRSNNYTSLTTSQFAKHLDGGSVPSKSVLITFDDGYLDNWVYAYPLLKKYGFNAVLFIVTSWIGHGVQRDNSSGTKIPITASHSKCMELISSGNTDQIMLRWSEVHAMANDGVFEFHSHTHTHTRWDKSEHSHNKNLHMQQELQQSIECLKKNIGFVSNHLCWPQGYFDEDYINIANSAGFKYLYTTKAFGQNRRGSDPTHIFRFAVRNTSGQSVGRRIKVAANPLVAPVFNGFKNWKKSLRK